MFARPSFFALMVQPSASEKTSRTISPTGRSPCPASRCLMNQAFSANRQASMMSGTPAFRQTSLVRRTLSSETGWPPPELFVNVSMTSGTLPRLSARHFSSLPTSMFPLKGWRAAGSRPSGMTKSTASPPLASTLARVVSKCVLFGTTSPGLSTVEKRRFSATRPWWVGMTFGKPKMSRIVSSKW